MDSFEDLGFAKLDYSRAQRTGSGEVVFCASKTKEHLLSIFQSFQQKGLSVLGTRCSPEQAQYLQAFGLEISYDECSKIVSLGKQNNPIFGKIAICTGGTSDIGVAEEAAKTAEFLGAQVERFYDVGIAGLHRLLSKIELIREADVIIAIAGMEGALAGVIAGLVSAPVIAVPTSVGYGASFGGIAPLLTMLNSCAEGIAVVNIDNGFGSATLACRILRKQSE